MRDGRRWMDAYVCVFVSRKFDAHQHLVMFGGAVDQLSRGVGGLVLQVVTCLRVWTGVLAAAPGEDELRTLIFPLAQVTGRVDGLAIYRVLRRLGCRWSRHPHIRCVATYVCSTCVD